MSQPKIRYPQAGRMQLDSGSGTRFGGAFLHDNSWWRNPGEKNRWQVILMEHGGTGAKTRKGRSKRSAKACLHNWVNA